MNEDLSSYGNLQDGPFEPWEYKKVVDGLKYGKCAAEDILCAEILKNCDFQEEMLFFCNEIHLNGRKPDQLSTLNLIPIPKKGNLTMECNYRGIAISSVVSKVYNKMLYNRIKPHIDKILRTNQNGARPKRSTAGLILAIRKLLEEINEKNLSAVLTFLDFSKAYDSICRKTMFLILKTYGIPSKLVKSIEIMYKNTKAKVVTDEGITDEFEIFSGILQGDTLAPLLFITCVDFCMRNALFGKESELGLTLERSKSRRYPKEVVTDLDFVDDITLLSDSLQAAQTLLHSVETWCGEVGLHVNDTKTEYMALNCDQGTIISTLSGKHLNKTDDFKYLGSYINSSEKDVSTRIALAWAASRKLENLWISDLAKEQKLKIFVACVESVLLYGCECWTLTRKIERKLDGTYTKLLRKTCNVSWYDKIKNVDLYGVLEAVSEKIRRRRLRFAGHCARHVETTANINLFWSPKHGKRSAGRPRMRYLDQIKRDTGIYDKADLQNTMVDRNVWRTYQ